MHIRWAGSADKHGVPHEDALNAMLYRQIHRSPFGATRVDGRGAPDLFIGPAMDGTVLEVMAERTAGGLVVFHVMPARPRIIDAARRQAQ